MKLLLAAALAVLGSVASTPAVAGAAHDPGPMRTVHALIDGWRTANFEQASKTFAPQFRLLTLRRSETGPEVQIDERDHLLGSMRSLSAGQWEARLGTAIEHQDSLMGPGQSYDVTVQAGSAGFYCHEHGDGTGTATITITP